MSERFYRARLRVEAGLVAGAHPLAVTEMRVWPSARPHEVKVLEAGSSTGRAPDFESGGWPFESAPACHLTGRK